MDKKQADALREPFPPQVIGKLPKGGTMLDYVGHAAVTDRLLQVDPGWSWEPFALDENGLPALDGRGNLWIKLTIAGVTRIGVGDGKNAKEVIGDAIRNAAMRFGVALDLWAKEDLHAMHQEGGEVPAEPEQAPQRQATGPRKMSRPKPGGSDPITPEQVKKLAVSMNERGLSDRERALEFVASVIGRPVGSRNELTKTEASRVIDALETAA